MRENLNICLLNDSFPPLIDGVANTVVNYANIINGVLGGRASVATPKYPGADDSVFDFPVVRYPSLATEKMLGYRAGNPFMQKPIELLSPRQFDIIHTHCPFASGVLARTLREVAKAPLVFTYHTKFDIDIKKVVDSEFLQKTITKFLLSNISACDEVWTVSNGAADSLRNLGYEGECVIMENGVDFSRGYADKARVAELKKQYGIAEDMPVFIFVGRMMWYKNIRLIIESLARVRQRGVDYRMIFVGKGTDTEEIKAFAEKEGIADICIFAGAIYDREELRAYYNMGDLFVFPSTYDTNGIVVREAAACGVPSLLIKDSCAAEGITNYSTGIIVEEDADAIAAELVYAAAHREELKKIGENAMNTIYISWEDSVRRAYERYYTIIDNKRSAQVMGYKPPVELFTVIGDISEALLKMHDTTTAVKYKSRKIVLKVGVKSRRVTRRVKISSKYIARNVKRKSKAVTRTVAGGIVKLATKKDDPDKSE